VKTTGSEGQEEKKQEVWSGSSETARDYKRFPRLLEITRDY